MPKVPYQGYSDVAPSTANVSVATPPEAFGVGTAKAAEAFGGSISEAGNKLFQRAEAFQELHNQTESDEANVNFVNRQADLHAKYNALQGDERVKAWPAYKANTIALREEIAAGLSNDMSRTYFKRKSGNELSHTLFLGAASSAIAEKDYGITTAKSEMDTAVKSITDDPTNLNRWNDKERDITNAGIKLGHLQHGDSPDGAITQSIINTNISRAKKEQIAAINHVDPPLAKQYLDDAVKDKKILEPDRLALDTAITQQWRTITSSNVTNEVYSPDKPYEEMEQEGLKKLGDLGTKDPLVADHFRHTLRSRVTNQRYGDQQQDLADKRTILSAISTGDYQDDQQLFADRELAAVRDRIQDKAWVIGIPGMLYRLNKAKDAKTNADEDIRAFGMMKTRPDAFRDEDFTKWKLSREDMTKYQKYQIDMKANPKEDPVVQKAIGWLRSTYAPDMRALGVYAPPTGSNQDPVVTTWDKFSGGIAVSLDQWKQDHEGKPANKDDFMKHIAPEIFQKIEEPGRFWGTNKVPFWNVKKMDIQGKERMDFEKFGKQEEAQAIKEERALPTEGEKLKAWQQLQYMRLHEKEQSGGRKP